MSDTRHTHNTSGDRARQGESIRETIYRSLVTKNYDYVAKIDAKTKRCTVIYKSGLGGDDPPYEEYDADEMAALTSESGVVPEDRDALIANMLVEGIKKHLEGNGMFQFTCRCVGDDGVLRYKRIKQYYIDRKKELIVMTCEDVSNPVRVEMEKNAILASALEAANQASNAKSQFLSRMSHELRTPMNAILGLSALAAGEVGNPAAIEDTIGKIGLSARYLLSIINDILQMSRIESGRITLCEAPFNFEELISSINSMAYAQASEKGLDYDAVVNSFMEPVYIGDAAKLQQILVNVLRNAVKFTPPGGKVVFAMEQLRRENDRATLRFVISDTGVGIDEEFMPHLFDPFSQEATSYTSASIGTGLGLAITKSMVEMMGGHIRVQSVKNVGSTFTIELQLGLSERSQRQLELMGSMNLSKIKALVVDDDIVVCQTTHSTLTAMGIRAQWATSGFDAVEIVTKSHLDKDDFDTVFIDWKMPDMDGIETTRRIRKIVGADVTIIIMTAYDWRTIEAEAREAGVDMFMEKPIFQSSIVRAFEKIFLAHTDEIEAQPPVVFNFTGKRILLVEDHPLNVEVTKRLLESVCARVIVAGNGLEALELFTTSEDYYFDAILMDVRMPIMDGLTAAKNIRNLRKKGSRSIPIIAMTANAFDEDIDMSKAHGMDAHLAKPIEPRVLFSTLKRLTKD